MFRITTKTATLATLALALPGTAAAAPVDVAAKLEAHAVLNSGKALAVAKTSAGKAKELVQRSEAQMKRAYALTVSQGQTASGQGLEASAQFSSSAQAQGDKLAELVERSKGGLKASAADALARTARLQADLVKRVADDTSDQQESASTSQAQGIGEIGEDNASVTAAIAVAASGHGLKDGVRRALDRAVNVVRQAHIKLMEAVDELRKRSEGQGHVAMTQTQSSLAENDCSMSQAVESSKRADASFAAHDDNVSVGDKKIAGTGDDSGTVAVAGEAHVAANGGGGGC